MHVAARTEIPARTGDDDDLHFTRMFEEAEGVAKLGIAFEGQRILALGPVEGDRGDPVLEAPQEMLRLERLGVEAHADVPPSIVTAAPLMSRLCGRHKVRIIVAMPSG